MNHREKLCRVDGLRNDLEFKLSLLLLQHALGILLTGEQKDMALRRLRPDSVCELNTGHAGHEHVTDEQIGNYRLRGPKRLFRPVKGPCNKAGMLENNR